VKNPASKSAMPLPARYQAELGTASDSNAFRPLDQTIMQFEKAQGMATDIEIYCNCIARVRHHVGVVDAVLAGTIGTGHADLNAELIFVHLRKALEEIAFASLSANREKYSAARAGFATEWNARRMLGFIEKVNANFYPIPLMEPKEISAGIKHFDRVESGYLTKSDFETLYDGCAEVLHCRNPYAPGDPTINITRRCDAPRGFLCSTGAGPDLAEYSGGRISLCRRNRPLTRRTYNRGAANHARPDPRCLRVRLRPV
jgi:hypothetical protein